MKSMMALCATVLLLAAAGCADTGSGIAADPPATAAPVRLPPSPPVPTDAAGSPVVRPYRSPAGEGSYLHVPGTTVIASVLILGDGPRGVVVGDQANGGICQTIAFGRLLARRGYHVALFDWQGPYAETMSAATKALIIDGASRVAAHGTSGGTSPVGRRPAD